MNKLQYALLILLAEEPGTGYDLLQKMKKPLGFFWQANHSQIYPELARLEAEGLVEHTRIEQSERPDKKLYHITSPGLVNLQEWLTAPHTAPAIRDELALKAYCLWLASPQKAIELFKAEEYLHREKMVEYEQRLQICLKLPSNERSITNPNFGKFLTLMRGISYERELAEWCKLVVEKLSDGFF